MSKEIGNNSRSIAVKASSKPSLRVKVINADSGLFKDLLVENKQGYTLFDAIYNTLAVKKANVRKWGSTVTQTVKAGTHEIKCSVLVGGDEAETKTDEDAPQSDSLHTYSVEELKRTSTRQLYHLVGGGDKMITFKLHCEVKPKTDASDGGCPFSRNSGSIPTDENGGAVFRCPFSGIAIDESAMKEFLKAKNAEEKQE